MRELEMIITKENSRKTSRLEVEEVEIAFHSKLYEISGNNVLKHLQGILRSFFKNIEESPKPSKVSMPPDHRAICKVLRNGSVDEFRQVMYKHLSVYKNY